MVHLPPHPSHPQHGPVTALYPGMTCETSTVSLMPERSSPETHPPFFLVLPVLQTPPLPPGSLLDCSSLLSFHLQV